MGDPLALETTDFKNHYRHGYCVFFFYIQYIEQWSLFYEHGERMLFACPQLLCISERERVEIY